MTVASPVSPRHVRHRKRSRLRRSKDFKAFLVGLQAVLNATGAAVTFTSNAVVGVKAAQTLTAAAIANADTVTIGTTVYTFQDTLTQVAYNVQRSGVLATDLATLAKAINGTGVSGTDYGTGTVAHPRVTATSDATHLVATAIITGAAENAVVTTATGIGTAWGASTLAGGVDQVNSAALAATAHGLAVGAGPFLATNSGGALPTGLPSTLAWVVAVPDANTLEVAAELTGVPLLFTSPGSGTNTLTKASTLDAVFDYLKKHGAPFMKHATDVDTL